MSASVLAASVAEPLARSSEGMKSGPIGLAVILLLCIACYFLFRSMSGHLRKVREDFPTDPPVPPRATPHEPNATDALPPPASSTRALPSNTTASEPQRRAGDRDGEQG